MPARLPTSSGLLPQPLSRTIRPSQNLRTFQTSATQRADAGVIGSATPKKPVGAFRGGLFGFLLGSVASGAATYYYILQEYRVSNEMLTEDIFKLQAAVQRIESYTRTLEAKVTAMETKKLQGN